MNFQLRTIDTIFRELLAEKNYLAELNNLHTNITFEYELKNTKVAEWVLQLYNQAVQIHLTELRVLSLYQDIETIIYNKEPGTPLWYIEKAKYFQYGDTLQVDGTYEVIDETKQVVKAATTQSYTGLAILKVRGENGQLTEDELNSLINYFKRIEFMGDNLSIWSYPADYVKLNLNIVYDKTYSLSTISSAVINAINDYCNNIEFDSVFSVNKLVDKLQLIEGVIDPQFLTGEAKKYNVFTYTPFSFEYLSFAGYCQFDSSFSNITYTKR